MYTLCRKICFRVGEPVFPIYSIKCGLAHTALIICIFCLQKPLLPLRNDVLTVFGHGQSRSAHMNSPRPGGGDAFCLALFDVFPFALSDKAEDLKHQIRDEGAHQIFSVAGIQQGHVDHADVDADILCQGTPLILSFFIVPAQSVKY